MQTLSAFFAENPAASQEQINKFLCGINRYHYNVKIHHDGILILLAIKQEAIKSLHHYEDQSAIFLYRNGTLSQISTHGAAVKHMGFYFSEKKNFTITPIVDGTIVSLYYLDANSSNDAKTIETGKSASSCECGNWKIATTKCTDIADTYWMGPNTYLQNLNECLVFSSVTKNNGNIANDDTNAPRGCDKLNFEKFTSLLDRSKSYLLRITHPNFHPLARTPSATLMFEVTNATAKQASVLRIPTEFTALPVDQPLSQKNQSRFWRNLLADNRTALSQYLSSKRIIYGFIIRSEESYGAAAYLYESELLAVIRKFLYSDNGKIPAARLEQYKGIEIGTISGPDALSRFKYLTLRAYLNYQNKYLFVNMFDFAAPLYSKIRNVIDNLVRTVTLKFRLSDKDKKYYNAAIKGTGMDVVAAANKKTTPFESLVQIFHDFIKANKILNNVPDLNSFDVVYDIICDQRHLNLLFYYLQNEF